MAESRRPQVSDKGKSDPPRKNDEGVGELSAPRAPCESRSVAPALQLGAAVVWDNLVRIINENGEDEWVPSQLSPKRSRFRSEHFLKAIPPGRDCRIVDLGTAHRLDASERWSSEIQLPEIWLHCESEHCGGARLFSSDSKVRIFTKQGAKLFLDYKCKNCSTYSKTYALWSLLESDGRSGTAFKYGERPQFGPPTPARVISLIGPQRDLFLKGRRAENQGMGIAAFAYYRRVIEDQKDRILDEVIKVCQRLSVDQPIIDELTKAKSETQFTTAVETVKHAIPQALLINGRNPLTLLHSALSEGLHAQSDEECLEVATSIRIVMAEFAERMGQALKEEAELNAAVSRLLQKKKAAPAFPQPCEAADMK